MSSLTVSVARLGRGQVPRVVVTGYIQRRHKSEFSLANYRRGKGGRSSFSGIVATVFGASGFFGNGVVNRLGKIGSQVIVPYRGDSYATDRLKLAGDLGQIQFVPYEGIHDEEAIRKSMMHSNVVINLIGRDWETWSYTFQDIYTEAPRVLARIAKESGIERFIHVSHINASPRPPRYLSYAQAVMASSRRERHRFVFDKNDYYTGGSKYLIAKHYGDLAVREEFPEAIIIKPSNMFGFRDQFINLYGSNARKFDHVMKLWKKGEKTVKQPVYYGDVANGIINAVKNPGVEGKTYAAVGPHRYYLSDIVDYIHRVLRYPEFSRKDFDMWYMLEARRLGDQHVPKVTFDMLERECITDKVPEDMYTLEDLNVPMPLTTLEEQVKPVLSGLQRVREYERELHAEYEVFTPPPRADETPVKSAIVI